MKRVPIMGAAATGMKFEAVEPQTRKNGCGGMDDTAIRF